MPVDLLGYLLNALDEPERQRVFESLQADPLLRQELEDLRQSLRPLDATNHDHAPPASLAESTCDLVARFAAQREGAVPPARQPRRPRVLGRENGERYAGAVAQWSPADALAIAGVLLCAALLFFPAIAGSRFRAQIAKCGENLRNIGVGLAEYSEHNQGLFPAIPIDGNWAVAGAYALILNEGGYFDDPRILVCPGSSLAARGFEFRIPHPAELDMASGVRLRELHRVLGGSYGYTLGSMVGGRYLTPQNQRRFSYALVADAPSLHLPGRQSGNHLARGQNVLFEDGHVEFLSSPLREAFGDDVFRNRFGYVEAGVDESDSVVASSFVRPLLGY